MPPPIWGQGLGSAKKQCRSRFGLVSKSPRAAPVKHPRKSLLLLSSRPNPKPCPRMSFPHRAPGNSWSLSQMWRPHGGHREIYSCPDPTSFSALSRRCRRMKPISQNRKPRSVFRLDPPSCALPPNKVPPPDPEPVPTASTSDFHQPVQATLFFSHQRHRSIAYLLPPIDPIENP
jgi:hypothetical protein